MRHDKGGIDLSLICVSPAPNEVQCAWRKQYENKWLRWFLWRLWTPLPGTPCSVSGWVFWGCCATVVGLFFVPIRPRSREQLLFSRYCGGGLAEQLLFRRLASPC
jgi:hypothetical protein